MYEENFFDSNKFTFNFNKSGSKKNDQINRITGINGKKGN